MSWQNDSQLMLRTMLNDAGCGESRYTTQRLEELLITSAYFLPTEINFKTSYTIAVSTYTIEGNFRNAALLQGVNARVGPAHINTSSYGSHLSTLLTEGPCKSFEELKKIYNFNYGGKKIIRAVMSPFAANDFTTGTINSKYDVRFTGCAPCQ